MVQIIYSFIGALFSPLVVLISGLPVKTAARAMVHDAIENASPGSYWDHCFFAFIIIFFLLRFPLFLSGTLVFGSRCKSYYEWLIYGPAIKKHREK